MGQSVGISVESDHGLYTPQAIINTIYTTDKTLSRSAKNISCRVDHSYSRPSLQSKRDQADATAPLLLEIELFWRCLYNAGNIFSAWNNTVTSWRSRAIVTRSEVVPDIF